MDKAVIGVRLEPVSLRYGLALLLTQRQVATRYRRRGASPGVPLGLEAVPEALQKVEWFAPLNAAPNTAASIATAPMRTSSARATLAVA
jgi:hypothetical protein